MPTPEAKVIVDKCIHVFAPDGSPVMKLVPAKRCRSVVLVEFDEATTVIVEQVGGGMGLNEYELYDATLVVEAATDDDASDADD